MGRLPDFVQPHANQACLETSITELRKSGPRLGDWAQIVRELASNRVGTLRWMLQ